MKIDKKIIILVIVIILVAAGGVLIGLNINKDNKKFDENNNIPPGMASYSSTNNSDASVDTDDSDEDIDWSKYENTKVSLSESYVIKEGGIYTFTGTLKDGSITVDTDDYVKIILNDVSIYNSDGPCINIVESKTVVIELKGENTLESGETYSDTELDGVIYSKADLVIGGDGTLNITSNYEDAIKGKDDLKITSGTYNIKSADDGIIGKDSVYILGGTFNIKSEGDGIKSSNDSDTDKGFVYIKDGKFNINSGSDGVQAITKLVIDGGTFNINAEEGLEATYVVINDGKITIESNDDGINASDKSTFMTPTVEINGGEITINMSSGDTDGIDANGNIYVNGGTVNITGQSSFDYDNEGIIKGGTVIVNGEKVTTMPNQMMGPGGNQNGGQMMEPGGNQNGGPMREPGNNNQRPNSNEMKGGSAR